MLMRPSFLEWERNQLRGAQRARLTKKAQKAPAPSPKLRALNQAKRRHLIDLVAAYLRQEREAGRIATFLNLEAPLRYGLRVRFINVGFGWREADAAAADIVSAAMQQIGAVRPTWQQGQPEWTQDGYSPIERTRCVHCRDQLEGDQTKFCSSMCATTWHKRYQRLRAAEEGRAYDIAAGL